MYILLFQQSTFEYNLKWLYLDVLHFGFKLLIYSYIMNRCVCICTINTMYITVYMIKNR